MRLWLLNSSNRFPLASHPPQLFMNPSRQHVIIYSHGFGVERDARGMFTETSAAFPDAENILFDYNIPNRTENSIMVRPLSEQKDILLAELARVKERSPAAMIDIVAHSLGCVVVALAEPLGIRKTIFLAPPLEMSSASLKFKRFTDRPDSIINPDGISRLARSDGSMTLVPAEFWKERETIDLLRSSMPIRHISSLLSSERRMIRSSVPAISLLSRRASTASVLLATMISDSNQELVLLKK